MYSACTSYVHYMLLVFILMQIALKVKNDCLDGG